MPSARTLLVLGAVLVMLVLGACLLAFVRDTAHGLREQQRRDSARLRVGQVEVTQRGEVQVRGSVHAADAADAHAVTA